jgi:hypothetical protein
VKELDPPAEHFEPQMLSHPRLRVYVLNGRHAVLVWCRDAQDTWQRELAEGKAPDTVEDAFLDLGLLKLGNAKARIYDPWENQWSSGSVTGDKLSLPPFKRSIVVRFRR